MPVSSIDAPVRTAAPRRREELRCHEMDDEAVVYDVAHHAVHYLNRTAYQIWTLCDGRRSVEAIADIMATRYGLRDPVDQERLRADILRTIEDLERNGLFDAADGSGPWSW